MSTRSEGEHLAAREGVRTEMTSAAGTRDFDVIVVGGSYAGLAAAMALGRALRKVLVLDGGRPCNAQTPRSHNFLTQDGRPPAQIAALARHQVQAYGTVAFADGIASDARPSDGGFLLRSESGAAYSARTLVFATGIKDQLPPIGGLTECWGISALHCPYCHGYEVRQRPTGILGNGDSGFELTGLVSNWTSDLILLTNGAPGLTQEQLAKLARRGIAVRPERIAGIEHTGGRLRRVVFEDGTSLSREALYLRPPFEQHCRIPEALGCALTPEGYIKVEPTQKTSVPGVYACGDNSSAIRTVANAVAAGTTAGMMANKELVLQGF